MRQTHILGDEIKTEIKARRKANADIIANGREEKKLAKNVNDLEKKIEHQLEFPIDPDVHISSYELNVNSTSDINPTIGLKTINGEPVDRELFRMKKDKMREHILSLCVEKWSHQARSNKELRAKMPPSEVEELGRVMPYELQEGIGEKGKGITQTYFIHDNTPDSHEQNKGCLYIDSETGLSVPVTFILPKKEGDDMHIEYVYGIVGSIEGMKVEKINT